MTDLEAFAVSMVKSGAVKRRVAVTKSEEENMNGLEEVLKACMELELDDESEFEAIAKQAGLSDKAMNAARGAMRLLSAFKDEDGIKGLLPMLSKLLGEPMKARKADEEYGEKKGEKKDEKKDDAVAKADQEPDLSGLPADKRAQLEGIWKAHREEVVKREELELVLKTERDERREKEFVAKAAEEFSHVPGESAELGMVLKAVADVDEGLAGKLEEILKAAEKTIAESELLKERGSSAESQNGGNAWQKIEAMADGLVEKSAHGISHAQAITKVLATKQGEALYNAYLGENPAQGHAY